jgi:GNAT superfamily N-acetyltransferase
MYPNKGLVKEIMDLLTIRAAQVKDCHAIAVLCGQLGYPAAPGDISLRLEQIVALQHHAVFLAELDQQVIGWIHVYLCPLLISPMQAQLGGLIVHAENRGKGVGVALLQAAETWARRQDCEYMVVYTNITRTDTHLFYDELGYENIKSEHVLRKHL